MPAQEVLLDFMRQFDSEVSKKAKELLTCNPLFAKLQAVITQATNQVGQELLASGAIVGVEEEG